MELVYSTLKAHLDNLVDTGQIFNYVVTQLGNPQSTGIVECHKVIGTNVYKTLHIYKVVNDEYVVTDLSNYYYYIDGRIFVTSSELNTLDYTYSTLTPEQIEFYLANPNLSAQEILNMAANPIPTLSELKLIKKSELDTECQNEILTEYPLYKQLNITNQNGYTENDLFTMNLYIAKRRSKLSLLNGMVDGVVVESGLDDISWDILYDTLVDTIIGMGIGSSLDVAKLKKLNELKVWDKELTDDGYLDSITSITLATKDSDITSFTKDLTGLSSMIKEAETNVDVIIPTTWPFIDINSSFVTNLTPNHYISLLNRYFVSVRNNKFIYANYQYQIYTADSVEAVNLIIIS